MNTFSVSVESLKKRLKEDREFLADLKFAQGQVKACYQALYDSPINAVAARIQRTEEHLSLLEAASR